MLADGMTFEEQSLAWIQSALPTLAEGFSSLPPTDAPSIDEAAMLAVLQETATRLRENYPYFHPLYAGQMLKPPHSVARAAYALATWINPNNHALDGGRASSQMEIEAVKALANMFWVGHPPRPPHQRRYVRQLGGALDRRPASSRQDHSRLRAGTLHSSPYQWRSPTTL